MLPGFFDQIAIALKLRLVHAPPSDLTLSLAAGGLWTSASAGMRGSMKPMSLHPDRSPLSTRTRTAHSQDRVKRRV